MTPVDSSAVARDLATAGLLAPRTPADLRTTPIGHGQLAESLRVTDGTHSVVVKLPSLDPDSAATARRIGAYARERRFYTEIRPALRLRTPRLLGTLDLGGDEPGLVLEDLSGRARPLDQLSDGTIDQVRSALTEVPNLQAPHWDRPELAAADWLYNRTTDHIDGLAERYAISWARHRDTVGAGLDPREREMVTRFGAGCVAWAATISGPASLMHQDLRLDNLLWGTDGAWLVDWQTLGWGSPAWDVAFLLVSALEPSERTAIERDEVDAHAARLAALGATDWGPDRAWTEYRRLTGSVLLAMVPALAYVKPTDRGFAMFASLIRRGARAALDHDVLDLCG